MFVLILCRNKACLWAFLRRTHLPQINRWVGNVCSLVKLTVEDLPTWPGEQNVCFMEVGDKVHSRKSALYCWGKFKPRADKTDESGPIFRLNLWVLLKRACDQRPLGSHWVSNAPSLPYVVLSPNAMMLQTPKTQEWIVSKKKSRKDFCTYTQKIQTSVSMSYPLYEGLNLGTETFIDLLSYLQERTRKKNLHVINTFKMTDWKFISEAIN